MELLEHIDYRAVHGVTGAYRLYGCICSYWSISVIGLYIELLEHIGYRAVYGVTGAYRL